MKNILIIDDDIHIGNFIEEALTQEGYRVSRAYSGTEALLVLSHSKLDLILLDLMLPGLNGEAVLPKIQGIPVIVVSAKIDIDNKVDLLLGGAADYVTKPFHIRELLARIFVQLKNSDGAPGASVLSYDDITLHTDTHMVNVKDTGIKLTRTEFAEDTPDCTKNSLKMHISNLRKKLREVTGRDYIEAVWGIGFKMRQG
ncbi:MAG: response regulator transcription factor [Lachnospiraceae bacterium]|nr:response regulator transcription factor [Lachnospiraceae bacterium]